MPRVTIFSVSGGCKMQVEGISEAIRVRQILDEIDPTIDGKARLIAHDGRYLGEVSSNRYESDSICNRYGEFGSRYSSTSVRNKYSPYGSKYGSQGAYNEYTTTPPAIVYQGAIVGYLTKNKYLSGAVDPDMLFAVYDCVY